MTPCSTAEVTREMKSWCPLQSAAHFADEERISCWLNVTTLFHTSSHATGHETTEVRNVLTCKFGKRDVSDICERWFDLYFEIEVSDTAFSKRRYDKGIKIEYNKRPVQNLWPCFRLPKNLKVTNILDYNFICSFVSLWNLVSRTKGRTQGEGIWERDAEVNIWT